MSKNESTKVEATNDALDEFGPVIYEKTNLEKLYEVHKTKSAIIRYLASTNMSRSDIAKLLEIRYQHVRNVLTQPLKKS